jgi:hypothetical protein
VFGTYFKLLSQNVLKWNGPHSVRLVLKWNSNPVPTAYLWSIWQNTIPNNFFPTGGMQDYNYIFHGCMELTLEISCCKHPLAQELPKLWDDNREVYKHFSSYAQC